MNKRRKKKLPTLLIREGVAMARMRRSRPGRSARSSRALIQDYLDEARQSGDVGVIVDAEGEIIRYELQRHANLRAMRTSLEASLAEHAVATGLLETMRDPGAYR